MSNFRRIVVHDIRVVWVVRGIVLVVGLCRIKAFNGTTWVTIARGKTLAFSSCAIYASAIRFCSSLP